MNDTSPTIPQNMEHVEAHQAQIHASRAAIKATLPPESQAKLTAIEQASELLEQAKVPYVLWASSSEDTGPDAALWFIRFNRLEYGQSDSLKERGEVGLRRLYWSLAPTISAWAFKAFGAKVVAAYDKDQKAMFYHDVSGERPVVVTAKEQPAE